MTLSLLEYWERLEELGVEPVDVLAHGRNPQPIALARIDLEPAWPGSDRCWYVTGTGRRHVGHQERGYPPWAR